MTTENQAPDPARDFLDDDGENRAVRAFLMLYGAGSPTAAQMAVHMRMSGFDVVPEWVERSPGHLTKGGAQLWLRQLFALEAIPAPEGAQLPPLPEPHWPRGYHGAVPSGGYTADQMHAYARSTLAAQAPTDNNSMGKAGCFPAAEKTNASPAEAHGDVLVPLSVLEDASLAISAFVSDHGWGDEDMQAMDNLDAYIARHKANAATKVDTQPKGMPQQQAWVWNPASLAWEAVQTPWHRHSGALYAYGPTPPDPLAPSPAPVDDFAAHTVLSGVARRKVADLIASGYRICGYTMERAGDRSAVVFDAAVRWLTDEQRNTLMFVEGSRVQAPAVGADALGYATRLAESIFDQHFASDPHYVSGEVVWKPFDDLMGVLTQIDNMVSGLERAEPPGLSLTQEPKYTVNGHAIVNRASGEEIPADEPVFIFRARDRWAAGVLGDYCGQFCNDPEHVAAVEARFIQFAEWAAAHPERMKEPDTAPASQPPVQHTAPQQGEN